MLDAPLFQNLTGWRCDVRPIRLLIAFFAAVVVAGPAATTAQAAPAAPTTVTAEPGSGQVRVKWALPASTVSSTVLWQELRWRLSSKASTLGSRTLSSGVRENVVGGLAGGTSYAFSVRAVTLVGTTAWSPIAEAAPVGLPTAPTAITSKLTGAPGAAVLSWTPAAENPATPTTSFKLVATTDGTTATLAEGIPADQKSATVQLPQGKTSLVGVSAVGATGASAVRTLSVYIPQLSMPVVRIDTTGEAPIVSKDDYVTGSLTVSPAPGGAPTDAVTGALEIKGRGNSTWNQPKKPYRLKLGKAAALLGMPSSKHWVLLANFLDKSALRNSIAFELGAKSSLAWTPKSRFVEVVLNGKYVGLYQLVEQIRLDKQRINIDALSEDDTTGDALTGGYHIERDARWDAKIEPGFLSSKSQPFTLKDPEEPTPEQLAYIKGYVNSTESAIFGTGFKDPVSGYAKYIDVPSFIDWFLIHEYLRVNDAWYSSTNMYKPRLGKLYAGPLWDFDLSMGTPNPSSSMPPTGAWVATRSIWFKRLLEDPAFLTAVKARWKELRPAVSSLPAYIDQQQALTSTAAAEDFKVWGGKSTQPAEITRIRAFLQARATWMDSQYGG